MKRYNPKCSETGMVAADGGNWISIEDYRSLAAEAYRLQNTLSECQANGTLQAAEIERLKDEIETLRLYGNKERTARLWRTQAMADAVIASRKRPEEEQQ